MFLEATVGVSVGGLAPAFGSTPSFSTPDRMACARHNRPSHAVVDSVRPGRPQGEHRSIVCSIVRSGLDGISDRIGSDRISPSRSHTHTRGRKTVRGSPWRFVLFGVGFFLRDGLDRRQRTGCWCAGLSVCLSVSLLDSPSQGDHRPGGRLDHREPQEAHTPEDGRQPHGQGDQRLEE